MCVCVCVCVCVCLCVRACVRACVRCERAGLSWGRFVLFCFVFREGGGWGGGGFLLVHKMYHYTPLVPFTSKMTRKW